MVPPPAQPSSQTPPAPAPPPRGRRRRRHVVATRLQRILLTRSSSGSDAAVAAARLDAAADAAARAVFRAVAAAASHALPAGRDYWRATERSAWHAAAHHFANLPRRAWDRCTASARWAGARLGLYASITPQLPPSTASFYLAGARPPRQLGDAGFGHDGGGGSGSTDDEDYDDDEEAEYAANVGGLAALNRDSGYATSASSALAVPPQKYPPASPHPQQSTIAAVRAAARRRRRALEKVHAACATCLGALVESGSQLARRPPWVHARALAAAVAAGAAPTDLAALDKKLQALHDVRCVVAHLHAALERDPSLRHYRPLAIPLAANAASTAGVAFPPPPPPAATAATDPAPRATSHD
ncbi:hypothetical protein HK405_001431, partial [Cladochytrium tenue]